MSNSPWLHSACLRCTRGYELARHKHNAQKEHKMKAQGPSNSCLPRGLERRPRPLGRQEAEFEHIARHSKPLVKGPQVIHNIKVSCYIVRSLTSWPVGLERCGYADPATPEPRVYLDMFKLLLSSRTPPELEYHLTLSRDTLTPFLQMTCAVARGPRAQRYSPMASRTAASRGH
jgi:hypothetical protein